MCLHFRRQCVKSEKHVLCVQKPGKMSSETAFANLRCGLSFLKLKRDWNVTAVRKQPQPVPEIPLLCGSNRQEIRTRNSQTRVAQAGRQEHALWSQIYVLTPP